MSTPLPERCLRILVLVPRTLLPLEVEQACDTARESLSQQLGLKTPEVIDSFAWYRDAFARCGTWESWIWETVCGRDYGTRERHFDGFVVIGERLGRAGAAIADLAVRSNRAVLSLKGQKLDSVQRVLQVDPTDMVTGWTVETVACDMESP